MPKFLNHLDLNGNQLKNTKLEITDSPLAEEGVIHYHDTNNTVRYHDGTGFVTLGDSDVATSTAAGVVELFSDTTQTVAANSVSTTSSRTYGVQLNSDDQMVVNVPWSDTTIANTNTQNAYSVGIEASTTKLRLTGSGAAGATTDDIEFVGSGATSVTRTSADKFTISSTDTQNDAADIRTLVGNGNNGLLPASAGTTGHFLRHDGTYGIPAYIANTNTQNDAAAIRTKIGSGNNGHVPTVGNGGEFLKHDGTFGTPSYISNTDVDVSIANLKTKLAGGFASNAVTIGDADDVVTIGNKLIVTGDLQVDGTTTTLNTSTLDVEDLNITIAKGAADAAAANGAGITVDGASATLLYRNTNDNFVFNKRLDATSFHGPLTGNVTGNADTVTTNADLTGHITSTGNAAVLGSFTVAQLSTALSDATISGSNSGDGTYGIADTNYVKIDGTPVNGEFAQFTANGLKSRTDAQVVSDIGAVAANAAITGASKAKITFDAKGLVTGGADLASGDIPNNAANTSGSAGSLSSVPTWNQNTTGTAAGITAGAVGAVKVVELTHGANGVTGTTNNTTDSATWTITHGMGASRFYKVEVVQDSGNYDTVYVDVTRPTTAAIKIDFGAAVANGAYRAMITRMA